MNQPDFCTKCQSPALVRVIASEGTTKGRNRRYKCGKCGARWSTNEVRDPKSYLSFGDALKIRQIKEKREKIALLIQEMGAILASLK